MVITHPCHTHPIRSKRKSRVLCEAFAKGMPWSAPRCHVFYGVNETNLDQWHDVLASGEPWYYIDNSYFDKVRGGIDDPRAQFRITKNRMQVRAAGLASDGKRFAALGIGLRPWQHNPDDHTLFVEQSPAFMRDIAEDPGWLARASAIGHLHRRVRRWSADKPRLATTLADDLRGARLLVTHSSAAAVEALIAGVPISVSVMSALHGYRNGDDRLPILNVLADNQWTLDEITSGKAWEWLNRN